MRVGSMGIYNNFSTNQQDFLKDLLKVNNQITSGKQIKYGYEDSNIYIDTMRLDHEHSTLVQISDTTSKAKTFSDNTDVAIDQMKKTLESFKVKLIHAANDVHSTTSLSALANDLHAMRTHILSISNTSINGNFLFSGTNFRQKPFDPDGMYRGNADNVYAQAGDERLLAARIVSSFMK